MATMRAMAVQEENGDFVLEEREIPEAGPGEALVKVHACGVCHSDVFAKQGTYGGGFPLIPGHEIAGEIAALGDHVEGWEVGQRVGVGWFGGNCGWCEQCRRGHLIDCENGVIPGVTIDGGYAEYIVVRASALAAMPDGLSDADAGPLLCAGITTFNALRTSGAQPGDRVAVLGVGGLGHLAIQYATRFGFETIAIARGTDKEELARKLGADHYVDSTAGDPAEALQKLGGVDLILSTITSADAMGAVFGGLNPRGAMMVVGASMDPLPIPAAMFIGGDKTVEGHASGTSIDSEDTLRFSARTGVRPMIETMGLEQANEAFAKMMSGDARFRMVLQVSLMTVQAVGINHVGLEVDDLDVALDWYARFFAFELRGRHPGMAFLDLGDQFLALALREDTVDEADRGRHVGLVVADKEAVRSELRAAGHDVADSGSLRVRDPSGNQLEIVDYRDVQFSKTDAVLAAMGLDGLQKSDAARAELREKGLAT